MLLANASWLTLAFIPRQADVGASLPHPSSPSEIKDASLLFNAFNLNHISCS